MSSPSWSRHQVVAACRLDGLGSIEVVRRRTGGQLSGVYEVRATNGHVAIIKVYAEKWVWKQSKEARVYELLRPVTAGLTPEILDARDASNPTGFAYTVMSLFAWPTIV